MGWPPLGFSPVPHPLSIQRHTLQKSGLFLMHDFPEKPAGYLRAGSKDQDGTMMTRPFQAGRPPKKSCPLPERCGSQNGAATQPDRRIYSLGGVEGELRGLFVSLSFTRLLLTPVSPRYRCWVPLSDTAASSEVDPAFSASVSATTDKGPA
jgi:hypothetical protein